MTKLFLLVLFSLSAIAQVQIQVVDPSLDMTPLKEDNYKINTERKDANVIPNKTLRDDFFSGVELPKSWDELDKDIFYMDLKSKSLDKLKKKYPQLDAKQLKKLKAKRE